MPAPPRGAGRHRPRPRFPRSPGADRAAEIRRDYAALAARPRAPRRRGRRHLRVTPRGEVERAPRRRRASASSVCPPGAPAWPRPVDRPRRRADPLPGHARAAQERRRAARRLRAAARGAARRAAARARRRADAGVRAAGCARSQSRRSPGRVTHLGYVSDAERAASSTRSASMLVLPSLDEGLRDAGARSDDDRRAGRSSPTRGALPEVVGDAGLLVEPDDAAGWRRRWSACLTDAGAGVAGDRGAGSRARARSSPGTRARAGCSDASTRRRPSGDGPAGDCAARASASTRASCWASRPASAAISASCCGAGPRAPTPRARRFVLYAPEPLPCRCPSRQRRASRGRRPAAAAARGGSRRTCAARSARDPPDVFFAAGLHGAAGARRAARRHDSRRLVRRAPRMVPAARGRAAALLTRPRRAHGRGASSPISEFSRREIVRAPARSIRQRIRGHPAGRARGRRAGPARRREPLVLFVGSLFNRRRLPDLSPRSRARPRHPAAARLVDRRRRSHLAAAGSARGWRATHGVGDRVDFRDYVPDDELDALYAPRVGLRVPVGVRRVRPDAARSALRRRADRRPRHADRARGLRRCGLLRAADGDVAATADGAAARCSIDPARRRARCWQRAPAVLARYSWDAAADADARRIEEDRAAMTRSSIVIVSFNARADLERCLRRCTRRRRRSPTRSSSSTTRRPTAARRPSARGGPACG